MNEIDQLVQELYAADAPLTPAPEALWASVESRIGALAGSSSVRRRRHRRRFALAFGLALAGAIVLAFLPALRHSPDGAIPENASAAQVLRTLADRSSALPDVPRGSFLYSNDTRIVLSTSSYPNGTSVSAFIRQHWQLWVGRDGSVRQRVRTEREYVGYPTPRARRLARRYTKLRDFPLEDTTTHSLKAFRDGFGMTLSAMRRLPTDPSALARAVLANPRTRVWYAFGVRYNDPFEAAIGISLVPVRPATRAAMLRALATLPHVRRLPDESVAGRPTVAVAYRFVVSESRHDAYDHVLLLDPATGALLGSRYVSLFPTAGLPAGTAINRWTYRQAVVPTLHSVPKGG
jgi:hypothetical protein